MKEKKTVAIFGGSFSPVHSGHIAVATGILDKKLADEVWLLPCRRNPLKETGPVISDEKRIELIEKAINYVENSNSGVPVGRLKVSDIELHLPEPSYTFLTMKKLTEEYPECDFRLVVGSDSYLKFKDWRNWEWLEKNFSPVVYPRPGYDIQDVRPSWTYLRDVRLADISSSEIRDFLNRNIPWLI